MTTVIERRAAMFAFFKDFPNASLQIAEQVSVPDFRPRLRAAGIRTGHFLAYALTRASLQVPQFRLRVKDGEMLELSPEELHCSYVVRNPHTDINHCRVLFNPDLRTFAAAMQKEEPCAQQAKEIIQPAPDPDHITAINISIIPWLRLSSLVLGGGGSMPLFTVGRLEALRSSLVFTLCVFVHHGLADAYHVHQFIKRFRQNVAASMVSL